MQAGKDNYTSAGDVAKVLKKMYNHQLIDATEDAAMLDILAKNTDHTMLPHSLPSEAQVYNLTGRIPLMASKTMPPLSKIITVRLSS
ncbi:serine hydrolase [Lactiplantibacillus fabifermentans]|uniref:serine hydrolase n=1 Tax=Lactiplantibacillus fabifermentans TaxID=483011 RepID=UPI001F40F082|nr:serine hydrolase [Lactiplantibacillus fabifermentans]